jgi:hypothetical protein
MRRAVQEGECGMAVKLYAAVVHERMFAYEGAGAASRLTWCPCLPITLL